MNNKINPTIDDYELDETVIFCIGKDTMLAEITKIVAKADAYHIDYICTSIGISIYPTQVLAHYQTKQYNVGWPSG